MNKMFSYPTCSIRRSTAVKWMALIILSIWQFFSRRTVKMALRMAIGGSAFMLMLAVVGGMEYGSVPLLPGAAICVGLVGLAFVALRGLEADG